MVKEIKDKREYLEGELARLTENLASVIEQGASIKEEGNPFGKKEEAVAQRLELEKKRALVIQLTEQLNMVKHALGKLENGTYGLCDGCGNPIPDERLEVMPQTSLCLSCKTKQTQLRSRIALA